MRTLCLGEALVDLICEHPVSAPAEADLFRPYFGGAAANVCISTARHGAPIALAGGVGDDPWGRWLHAQLEQEGVDLAWFSLLPRAQTPVAFVTVDVNGEPSFSIYGDGIRAAVESVASQLPEAVSASDAFAFASNTLVGSEERAITLAARDRALSLDRPLVFDPNLRLHRWPSTAEAIEVVRACIPGTFLLKCNAAEAKLLTGASDVERAAELLLAAGARHVVVTLGAGGAMLRGPRTADAPGVPARVTNATGAGDAFLGVLLASLATGLYDDDSLVGALPRAVEHASRATERWGAV